MSLSSEAPSLLIVNNFPIIFGIGGATLISVNEDFNTQTEDRQKTKINDPTNKKEMLTTAVPVFNGLRLEIQITTEKFEALFAILKPLMTYVYKIGDTQITAFFSPFFYILNGVVESSSLHLNNEKGVFFWNLTIKQKQLPTAVALTETTPKKKLKRK